jgi:hypothetical protein
MRHNRVFPRFLSVFLGKAVAPVGLFAILAVGGVAIGVLSTRETGPNATRCGGGVVTVIAGAAADREAGCAGAGRAIAVLDDLGLPVLGPIVVQVVDELVIANGVAALGTFDPRTRVVKVLARSAYSVGKADEGVLGLPLDDHLHASVFAHEVTHAVFHQHEARIPLSPAAHEYVAYSVQLTTLPPDHRRRVLERFKVSPFDNVEQVNGMILAFDPNGFGVKAFLHFQGAADQNAVLENLIRASRAAPRQWY